MAQPTPEWINCYIPNTNDRMGRHAKFAEIMDRIVTGWTSRAIERWLTEQNAHPVLTCLEIENYIRANIPPRLLTAEQLLERLGKRAYAEQIDELGVLQQLCMAQINRVSRMIQDEDQRDRFARALVSGSDVEAVPTGDTAYDKKIRMELEQLRKLLVASAEMKFRMGILKQVPQQISFGQMGGNRALPDPTMSEDSNLQLTEREKERTAMVLHQLFPDDRGEDRR